jgi:hypothetical protein
MSVCLYVCVCVYIYIYIYIYIMAVDHLSYAFKNIPSRYVCVNMHECECMYSSVLCTYACMYVCIT